MKLKELLDIMCYAKDKKTTYTLIDYDIFTYLDDSEEETLSSFTSDYKPECFLNDTILKAEVIAMGIKSETEMVFELDHDWDEEKEEQITDAKIPSKILEISVTKNELGLADVLIKDLQENEMLDLIQYLCEYAGAEAIFDKDGKWCIPLTSNDENEGSDGNVKEKED